MTHSHERPDSKVKEASPIHIMHEAYHTYGLGMSYAQSTFSVSINTTDTPSARPAAAEHTGPVTIIVSAGGSVLSGVKRERVEGGGWWHEKASRSVEVEDWMGGVCDQTFTWTKMWSWTHQCSHGEGGRGGEKERETWYLTDFWDLIFFTCQWGIMIERKLRETLRTRQRERGCACAIKTDTVKESHRHGQKRRLMGGGGRMPTPGE